MDEKTIGSETKPGEAAYCEKGNFPADRITNIDIMLQTRGSRYGEFKIQAALQQAILSSIENTENWRNAPPHKQEATRMIIHKLARIWNGDPDYEDSWDDIAGYATLESEAIRKEKAAIEQSYCNKAFSNYAKNEIEKSLTKH